MLVVPSLGIRSGSYPGLWTALLLGESNTGSRDVSIQVTRVEPGGEQALHRHPQAQGYYVVEGRGVASVDGEEREVSAGEAVFIPGGSLHGIRNVSNQAFGTEQERLTWPDSPSANG